MSETIFGWTGKVLHIDLTDGTTSVEHPNSSVYLENIGGKGLAGHYLEPHCTLDWDDPAMPVIFATGPLCATIAPTSGRCCVMSRSPLTGTIGDTSAGGRLATQLKRAGWDAVVITGQSDKLCGIRIENDNVEIVEAEDLRDRDTHHIFDTIAESSSKNASLICTGPAADHGTRMAAIMVDRHHAAGRCGIGLSFAAKNLKFMTVSGSQKTRVHDIGALKQAREDIFRLTAASPVLLGQHGFSCRGTGSIFDLMDSRHMMPTDNFRETRFADAKKFNATAYHDRYEPHKYGCKGCHILCKKVAKDGRSMPEFETMSHFTALIGNTEMDVVMQANDLCNRLGMDTISAASTLACKREIEGRDFTQEEVLTELEDMARGGELSVGSKAYAESKGRPELSMSVKGMELPAYDPRGAYGMSLAYALSTRGGCHLRAYPVSHEILRKPVATDRFSFSGKARIIKIAEDLNAVIDSLTACKFIFFAASLEEYAKAFTAVTGVRTSAQELLKAGERIYERERAMNATNGFTEKDDDLPPRFFEEHGTSGHGVEIKPLDREAFLKAREAYYNIRKKQG